MIGASSGVVDRTAQRSLWTSRTESLDKPASPGWLNISAKSLWSPAKIKAAPAVQHSADNPPTPRSRSRLRGMVIRSAEWAAVGLNTLFGDLLREGFAVLMYHRVAERTAGVAAPTWNVTPRQLRAQLEGLLSRGFQAWPLTKVLEACRESLPVPSNVFVVTFDDGFENNLLHALPILKELHIPATIFLATAFLDSDRPFPFDDWSAAGSTRVPTGSWRPLSTEQCRELLASGWIELGSHSHTHQEFLGRREEFKHDLHMSLEVLEHRFGVSRPTFAFPFGVTSNELIEAAKEGGVACALSTRPERVCANADPFRWGRFAATGSASPSVLAAQLTGWCTLVDRSLGRPIVAVANSILRRVRRGGRSTFVVTGPDKTSSSNDSQNSWHAPQPADAQGIATSIQKFSAP